MYFLLIKFRWQHCVCQFPNRKHNEEFVVCNLSVNLLWDFLMINQGIGIAGTKSCLEGLSIHNRSQFINHSEVLNFLDRILCYFVIVLWQSKKSKKYPLIFISLKLNHCEVYLMWICQSSLFMNTFNTNRSYIFYWYFPYCLKSCYK